MKKLAALLVALGSVFMANAYCIYNNASIPVYVEIGSDPFTSFKQTIGPGQNGCCNWQTEGCNPSTNRDEALPMMISSACGCYNQGQVIAGQLISFTY